MEVVAAGNTEVPAYLVLVARGYDVSIVHGEGHHHWWTAEKGVGCFSAESPLQLLGLVTMAEPRGENWRATDEEIHAFLKKYELA